jgi:hypothetical protein
MRSTRSLQCSRAACARLAHGPVGARAATDGGAAGKIGGYTPSQRFLLANALIWRGKTRTEWLINQLRADAALMLAAWADCRSGLGARP